jgi:acyl carrier protein
MSLGLDRAEPARLQGIGTARPTDNEDDVMDLRVLNAVYEAIDEVNGLRPSTQQLPKSTDTVLMGEGGRLDSLGLVNLVVATEQRVQDAFGVRVTLASDRAMSQRNSPFRTVQSLVEFVGMLLEEQGHG